MEKICFCLVFLFSFSLYAKNTKPMPEFGPSVKFGHEYKNLKLSKLKGKAVVIVFFQDWCPTCNKWAGPMIKATQAAHKNNSSVILMALKTDGGGVKGAEKYMRSAGADMDRWIIGEDDDADYYARFTNKKSLWRYALVDGNGELVNFGYAGGQFSNGPNKGKWSLEIQSTFDSLKGIQPVITGNYPEELADIVREAEMGEFNSAFKALKRFRYSQKVSKEVVEKLHDEIYDYLKKFAIKHLKVLTDENADWGSRYLAYKELEGFTKELSSHKLGRKVGEHLRPYKTDPNIREEERADDAWQRLQSTLSKVKGDVDKRRKSGLKTIAEKYPETYYGKLAADEVGKM